MNVQLSQVSLAWHIPDFTHPDVYPLDVLAIILGQGRSSRLYRTLQQDQGLVHSISSSSYTPAHPGLFIVRASVDPDQRDPAIAAVATEIDRVLTDGVTADEVQKAIKVSTSHYLADLKTMKGQASDIAHSQLLLGDPDFSRQYLDRLRRVTADQVQRVARQYLVPHGLTVTSLNPVQETPTTDVAAEKQAAIEIQKFEFPNGLRLLIREDPRLPLVSLQALCRGGVLAETAANNGITRLTARMLLKGTTNRSADQIAEEIESVGGSISDFSGNNSFGLSAEVLSDDLALGLDILADVILHPAFPEDLLARERDTQVAEIKAEDDRILRVAQQLLRESMYQAHPYRLNPLGQTNTVAGLTRADLVAFHREHIRPDQLVLCVFGNVDAEQVRTMIGERFGSLEQVAPPAAAPTSGDILKADRRRTEHRPREQAVLLLGYNGTRIDTADRYPLEIIDAAYSGQGSRLYLRIREELGLAYYVGAYQLLGLDPGYIAFYIGTTPDKVDTCETELRAELARLATDGLPADELERAKSSLIGQQLVRRQDNSELAFTAGLDELYGLGYDFSFAATDRYRAVSEDDIKQVAQRYFGEAASAVVIVGPAMDQEQPAPAGAATTEE